MCCMYTVYSGMQEWVIQIPSIPILVSVLFPSLHLKYFRIKFLLLVDLNSLLVAGMSQMGFTEGMTHASTTRTHKERCSTWESMSMTSYLQERQKKS